LVKKGSKALDILVPLMKPATRYPLVEVARAWGLNVEEFNGGEGKALGHYCKDQAIGLGVKNLPTRDPPKPGYQSTLQYVQRADLHHSHHCLGAEFQKRRARRDSNPLGLIRRKM